MIIINSTLSAIPIESLSNPVKPVKVIVPVEPSPTVKLSIVPDVEDKIFTSRLKFVFALTINLFILYSFVRLSCKLTIPPVKFASSMFLNVFVANINSPFVKLNTPFVIVVFVISVFVAFVDVEMLPIP